jgi:N-acetylneuraminic acid mutarotase
MHSARDYATATLLPNGLVLVTGGYGSGGVLASAELYNPATGTWTTTGSLNAAREVHTATLLPNGLVLVAGGMGTSYQLIASAELYNPATGQWTTTGSMNNARFMYTATLLPNGLVLVAGGPSPSYYSPPTTSAELYNPANGTWAVTASLNTAREFHTATLLPNGSLLVVGGGSSARAELYSPVPR